MSSVVISGDTSGSITLAAPAVAGSNTITLPASTGTVALTASPTFTGTATIPTATVTTLNAPSGVLATQNGMTGIAKAWVNFDGYAGSGNTINGSFNVSSITKNGTGDYSINFTTSMPNTNYAYAGVCAFGQGNNTATGRYISPYVGGLAPYGCNTTNLRITTTYAANVSNQDCSFVSIAVFSS